jgi:TPR repeat protein
MNMEDDEKTGLVPSHGSALSRSTVTSLIRRGSQDLIAKEAEQWLKKGQEFASLERNEDAAACFMRGIELSPRHSELLCHLAEAYHMGYGVQEDEVKALALYRQAAEEGNVEGIECVGWHYAGGYGVPQNDLEATNWWRKAADLGNAGAQCLLAWYYENGLGVPKDFEQAAHWYRKAADQGDGASREGLDRVLCKVERSER